MLLEPGPPRLGLGEAAPTFGVGTRVQMWKQDPSVHEMGTRRRVFLPGLVLDVPRDARIMFGQPGVALCCARWFGRPWR